MRKTITSLLAATMLAAAPGIALAQSAEEDPDDDGQIEVIDRDADTVDGMGATDGAQGANNNGLSEEEDPDDDAEMEQVDRDGDTVDAMGATNGPSVEAGPSDEEDPDDDGQIEQIDRTN